MGSFPRGIRIFRFQDVNIESRPSCKSLIKICILCTPYSMNSLFSESFRKFGGAFLEVCETISEGIWQDVRGNIKENDIEKIGKSFLATI